jgi:hypothetical protein
MPHPACLGVAPPGAAGELTSVWVAAPALWYHRGMRELVVRVQRRGQEWSERLALGISRIGSLANANVRLEQGAPVVAVIDADENGALLVQVDDQAVVTVNGAPLRGKVRLKRGDSIVFGDTTLTIQALPSDAKPSKPEDQKSNNHLQAALVVILGLSVGLGIPVFFLGSAIYEDMHAANIRSLGAEHKGTVIAIEDTGSRFNSEPVVWVTVEVDLGDRKVRGRVKDAISPVHLPRFQPGSTVRVWLDPKNPTDMALEEGL